jgi:hypothetical protein
MFFKGSRYAKVETLEFTDRDGRIIKYKAVRLIPVTVPRQAHKVQRGERLDHVADRYFRDPERFWRIADANTILWPDDLVSEPGERILIPASEE